MFRFHADMTGGSKAITDFARKVQKTSPKLYLAYMAYRNLHQGSDAASPAKVAQVTEQYVAEFMEMQQRLTQKTADSVSEFRKTG